MSLEEELDIFLLFGQGFGSSHSQKGGKPVEQNLFKLTCRENAAWKLPNFSKHPYV